MSNQGHAALAAWLLGHPVKCTLSRVESFRMHAKRHPITLDVRAGCDADGVLTGLHVRAIGDSGAYASVGMKVLERAAGHVAAYRWQSLDIEATAVRTNNPICGAFQGFGANQAQFATEGVIDRLAELAGIDPWEFRRKNVITPGDTWGPGQVMDDGAGGARECLDAIKPDYDRARSEGRSVGLAIGMKNSGLGNGFREVCERLFISVTTAELRCDMAGPRWDRGFTPWHFRLPLKNSTLMLNASTSSLTPPRTRLWANHWKSWHIDDRRICCSCLPSCACCQL